MTFWCVLGAVVWVSGDLLVCFGCCCVPGDLGCVSRAAVKVLRVFRGLQCGFRVTFGCVLNHLVQVSGDLRVSFGCAGVNLE